LSWATTFIEKLKNGETVRGDRYQIGNNIGRINGWTNKNSIFGICIKVED